MSASERASKLNALAVSRLNEAVRNAQNGEPDVGAITTDLMSGKQPAELNAGRNRAVLAGWILLIALMFLAPASKTIQNFVGPVITKILIGIPIGLMFLYFFLLVAGWMKSAMAAATNFTTGSGSGPKCGVSACGSSASYSLTPPGHAQVDLCYEHKNNLEKRVQFAGLFRPETAKSIVRAYEDLLQASKIDPVSPVIAQNLQQARELAEIVLERKLPA